MIENADKPKTGDRWYDHGCHVCTVIKVDRQSVTCRWASRDRPRIMSRKRFARFMRYETMPDKTWAYVETA